jgi:hypothetical protein
MATEDCTEVVSESIAAGTKVENGVVRNVKLLGKISKNKGGIYPVEVMREAVRLYDGAKTNIDHTRESNPNVSFGARFGVVRNPRVVGEEIRGDVHFNPKHPAAEQFIWAVENQPESIGFSHVAAVDWTPIKGGRVAKRIRKVKSVDVVADPATTDGVFEDVQEEPEIEELPLTGRSRALSTLSDDAFAFVEPGGKKDASGRTSPRSKRLWPLDNADAVRAAFNSIPRTTRYGEDVRAAALARATRAAAKLKIKLPGVPAAQSSEDAMSDYAGLTLEELRAQRPDLVDSLTKESSKASEIEALTKENAEFKAKFAAMEAEEKKRQRASEIDEALEDVGLDPKNPKHVGKAFRKVLEATNDPKEFAELVQERYDELSDAGLLDAESIEDEPEAKPTKESRSGFQKPASRFSGAPAAVGSFNHTDSKSFIKSLRAKR